MFRDTVAACCGFLAGWFLVDRESGRQVTLSMWEDHDALGQALHNLAAQVAADDEVADTVQRVNAHGVRFDTEVAHEIGPQQRFS